MTLLHLPRFYGGRKLARVRAGRDRISPPLRMVSVAFQSTRPRGARQYRANRPLSRGTFQSTRPRGARLMPPAWCPQGRSFNPRARVGRDLAIADHRLVAAGFNPRARVGRDKPRDAPQASLAGFNPRARVGRDLGGGDGLIVNARVSIHAPAWGATFTRQIVNGQEGVSIHAPAWGATVRILARPVDTLVSIHAPAWGATAYLPPNLACADAFQSTRPRGARPCVRHGHGQYAGTRFNPRARVGRDCMSLIIKNFVRLQNRFRRTSPSGA